MKISQLLEGVEILENNLKEDYEIQEVVFDSRKARPDTVFVAIDGVDVDGHKFIDKALENGSCCLVVQKQGYDNCVVVKDTRIALAVMVANFYGNPARSIKLIGVTGTNGKTTSTYLIKQVLESLGKKVGLIGTIQNMIGEKVIATHHTTPDPMELQKLFAMMRDEGVEYAVMEVSSHSLAQNRVYGLKFEVGVFTNLTQDHLDFHKTMENYLQAKAKLFSVSKVGVINYDDEYYPLLSKLVKCPVVTYSAESTSADIVAKNIKYAANGIQFETVVDGNIGKAVLNIPGKFTVYNALAVIGTCTELGISLDEILGALKLVSGVKGRVEVVPIPTTEYTILIDYAHTPDALYNVLSTVRAVTKGRVVALFGCGGDRDATKRPIMGNVAFGLADFCIVTTDNPRSEQPSQIIEDILQGVKSTKTPYIVIENRAQAIEYAIEHAQKNDIIVLAGKGHETYQILKDKTIHFDEREIINDIFDKRA